MSSNSKGTVSITLLPNRLREFEAEAGLKEALPYLRIAEADNTRLSMLEAISDVQWLLMVVYHNLGMTTEGKSVYERYQSSPT